MSKDQNRTKGQVARQVADDTREKLAKKILDCETVFEAVSEAASKGFYGHRVRHPECPFPLKDTKAAKHLLAKLRDHDFSIKWEAEQLSAEHPKNTSGGIIEYEELVIYW